MNIYIYICMYIYIYLYYINPIYKQYASNIQNIYTQYTHNNGTRSRNIQLIQIQIFNIHEICSKILDFFLHIYIYICIYIYIQYNQNIHTILLYIHTTYIPYTNAPCIRYTYNIQYTTKTYKIYYQYISNIL